MAGRHLLHRILLRGARWLILWAAFAIVPAIAAAQTAPGDVPAKLSSVAEVGSHAYSSEQVAALSGLQIGADVNRTAIQTAADALARTGLFSSVRYQFSTDAAGLKVVFSVEDAPAFQISLDNFPWLSDQDFAAALAQAGIPLRATAPASGAIDDQIAQALQKALEAKGIHAAVTHGVAAVPGASDSVVQFKAVGADVRVASLQFSDALAAHDPAVQNQLSAIVGKPFSLEAIERFDFEKVRPAYLLHSFLRVKLGAPTVALSNSNVVNVTVPVDPGAAYVWGGIAWNGNQAYTTSDLDALVKGLGFSPDQPVDGNKVLTIWQNVRTAYGHRGYIDVTVEPKENFDDAARRASYQVNVSEGVQYHMGNLVLTGLSIDAEKRLRAAWRISQGQVFDQTYCDYFLSQGVAEALKGLPAAQDTVGHFLQKNAEQKTVDVMIDFE